MANKEDEQTATLQLILEVITVLLIIVILWRLTPPKLAGFTCNRGQSLRYQTLLDSSNQGGGTNFSEAIPGVEV